MNEAAIAEAPPSVSTAVTVSEDIQSTLARHRGALEYALEAYPMLETVEVANDCSRHLKNLKRTEEEIAAAKSELLDPVKAWIERWISPTHNSIKAAIEHCDTKLLAWTKSEQERVKRERAAAEEADRKIRAEAQARAAAEEARSREIAEQRRREAAEAERRRKEAEEAGNKRAAAAAAAERARLEEEARAREEAGRQESQRIQQEAAARAPTEVKEVEKVAGYNTRKNWKARLAPNTTEDEAIDKIGMARYGLIRLPDGKLGFEDGERRELISMLKLDLKAASSKAKGEELNFNVPGLESWNDIGGASR